MARGGGGGAGWPAAVSRGWWDGGCGAHREEGQRGAAGVPEGDDAGAIDLDAGICLQLVWQDRAGPVVGVEGVLHGAVVDGGGGAEAVVGGDDDEAQLEELLDVRFAEEGFGADDEVAAVVVESCRKEEIVRGIVQDYG